jgi:DHA1 family tetracycline resistance protein-like MFS transporter
MAQPRTPGLKFIVVTLFLDILGIGLIVPILPRLIEGFAGDDAVLGSRLFGVLAAVYALMQFIFSPIIGGLSDRFGRRPVLLVSNFGAAFDYLLLALAPSLPWFFLGRVISGICGASIGTASAYIADVSPPEKRAQNFGLVGMAFGLGFVAGPLISAFLGAQDVRLPFYLSAGLSLLNALYGYFVLPESLPVALRRPFAWSRANPVGTLRELFRSPVVLGLASAAFFITLAQRGLTNVWVLYTEHRYHWDVKATGLSLGVVGLSTAVVQGGVVRRLMPRLGERRSIVLGALLGAGTYVLYGLATEGWMIYAILVVNAFSGFLPPAIQGLMSRAVPADEQGMLQGGLASVNSVCNVLGPLLSTNLFGYFISSSAPVYLPGAFFFLGSALILVGLWLAVRTFDRIPG